MKQVDSDFTNTGRSCFHMAVPDPNAPADKNAPPRESIEVRMFCYWKDTNSGIDTVPTKEKIHLGFIRDPKDRVLLENQPLNTASVPMLLKTLMERVILSMGIPLPILIVGKCIVSAINAAAALSTLFDATTYGMNTKNKIQNKKTPYSGNPEDYFDRFLREMEMFTSQPKFVHSDAKSRLEGHEENEGIQLVTENLVEDKLHKHGTATLREIEKREVVAYLLKNEQYMAVAKKHLGKLI